MPFKIYSSIRSRIAAKPFKLSVVEREGVSIIEALHGVTPVAISNTASNVISMPEFEVNDSGDAIAVWESFDSNNKVYVEAAIYSKNQGWQTSQRISDFSEEINPGEYTVHIDEQGYCSVLWKSLSENSPTHFRLRVNSSDFKVWSIPQTILEDVDQ